MKKILISLIIILLVFGIFTVIFSGTEIAGFTIYNYEEIKQQNDELEAKLREATKVTSIDFPETMSSLTATGKKLTTTKEKYEDKIAYSTEEEIALATQIKQYRLEFIMTTIGNYALKDGVLLDLEYQETQPTENIWNINFVVTGKYLPITEFIRDIENDDELNFRIEEFKLTPGKSTVDLKAEFSVKTIRLLDVDSSIINANITNNNDSNTDDTNNTDNAGGTDNTGNTDNAGGTGNTGNTDNAGGTGNAGNSDNAGGTGNTGSTDNAGGTGNSDESNAAS